MTTLKLAPYIIEGGLSIDDRGEVKFVNDFDLARIKRFYQITNHTTTTTRAFHGHFKETKFCYVTSGNVLICTVKLTSKVRPSKKQLVSRFMLSSQKPSVLAIPPGYANGFKSLTPNSSIIFYSDKTLEESLNDDYRFPWDYWGEEIWEVKNR